MSITSRMVQGHPMDEVMEIGRYRPNVAASSNGDSVFEYLVEVRQPRVELGAELPQMPKHVELPL